MTTPYHVRVANVNQKAKQLDARTFAVVIDGETTLGEFALSHFMRRLGSEVTRNLTSLRWDGDYYDADGVRWGRIRVTWREGQR